MVGDYTGQEGAAGKGRVMLTEQDIAIGALCAWRENRGGGVAGMQSVINVLVNRADARGTSVYTEAVRRWQFSSLTAPGDPNLALFPSETDFEWETAVSLMHQLEKDALPDITGGATSYYAASMHTPPAWAATMERTCEIQGQIFFRMREAA